MSDKGNLFVSLNAETPTIIQFNGQQVEIYLDYIKGNKARARIVANKDIQIFMPHKVRKGLHLGEEVNGSN